MRLSRKTKLLLIASGIIMLVFVLFVTTKHQYRTGEQAIAGRENVTAALSSITINTGSSEVPDSANITSQLADLAPDSGAYRWIRNGVNIMALNMPFNAGSSQTDFSGNNNAGTLGTGVSYMTSCQVGGCTQFTGVGDISIPHTSSLALVNNMTVSFWANVDTTKAGCFLRHVTTGTGNGFFFCHDNTKIGFEIWGNGCTDAYPYTALTNGWQHIAFTLGSDGRTFSIYRNGVLLGTDVSSVALNNVSTPYLIGTTTDNPLSGDCPPAGGHQYFTGQIDEFKIFPSVLTSSQLSSVYTDESLGGGAPATIVAEQTAPYDTWQLSVTPIDSDGIVGSASLSNEVSVSFGPTSITGTLDTANEAQNIQSVLTLPSGSYAAHNWWVNGSRLMGASIPFQSGSTQTDVTGNGRSTTNSGTAAIVTSGCKVDACLQLNGTTGAYSSGPMITSVANTFTYEFWVNPLSTRATTTEATAGITGTNSQRYVIWPWNGTVATGSTANAGIGVSVGTNGISVFEHTNSHVPSLLVYDGAISGWTHVVIVIQNKQPRLYVNGVLVRTGLTSTKSVYPSVYFGDANTNWGPFNGKVDEYRVYNRALTARQILHNYQEGGGSSQSAEDGLSAPTEIVPQEHAFGESWILDVIEFNAGTLVGSKRIGSQTITAAAATTLSVTAPSGTQTDRITVTYTCDNADDQQRDVLVQYSTNGGSLYNNASITSASSGSVSGSTIFSSICDGSSQSLVWDSISNGVALNNVADTDVRIKITALLDAAPFAESANFTVLNPTVFTSPTTINAGDATYDNTIVYCSGSTTLTINGAHTFTGLALRNGCTLTHSTNTTTQTNYAELTINGDLEVDATSFINVNGKGFQGGQTRCAVGFGPGAGNPGTDPGSGASFASGGASYGGRGGTGNNSNVASSYGSMSAPANLGSGGAGGGDYICNDGTSVGGAGGGYIKLVVSGTFTHNGVISANGNAGTSNVGPAGGGSGGSIWVDAATVAGSGTMTANGGSASATNGGSGGGGRIAVYFSTNNHTDLAGSLAAYGGSLTNAGSPGTVYLKPTGEFGDLIVSNNGVTSQYTTIVSGVTQFDTIDIADAADVVFNDMALELDETLTIGGATTTRFALGGTAMNSATGTADIIINSNGILSHDYNTTTRTNYIDISGIRDVTVNSGGSINVDGRGYRGGTTRCQAGSGPGAGQPGTDPGTGSTFASGGASHGGRGGTGNNSSVASSYGSMNEPVELGSGGAGGGEYQCNGGITTGGAGGGAIKIVGSGTLTVNGTISANGAVGTAASTGPAGGGAGGSIWLNFGTIGGSSTISANGGSATSSTGGSGGGGRIAIYYTTNSHSALTTSLSARGGSLTNAGSAGTIYVKDAADNLADLYMSNGGTIGQYTSIISGVTQFESLTIGDGANVVYNETSLALDELLTIGGTTTTTFATAATTITTPTGVADVIINNNGVLSHSTNTTTQTNILDLSVRNVTINSGGAINVIGKGYQGGQTRCQNGYGPGGGRAGTDPGSGSAFGSGGGIYGGRGGNGNNTNFSTFYGSISAPADLGSGGAGGGEYGCNNGITIGGAGGGYVKLVATGTLTLTGSILADGGVGSASGTGAAGGGSGGSVWLDISNIAGSGTITANGGAATGAGGGSGGGGRIAVHYDTNNHSNLRNAVSVAGGSIGNPGSAGTAFLKQNTASNGDLITDNNNISSTHSTNLFVTGQPSTYTFQNLYVNDLAKLLIDTPCSGTPALTVLGATDLSGSGTITNNQSGTCTVSQLPITVTTTTLPGGIVSQAYSQTLSASGGYSPYSWVCRSGGITVACTTVLPTGLDMTTGGVISGTPTTPGTFNFTIRATESSPGVGFDEQDLSITVGNAPTAPTNLFVDSSDASLGSSNPTGIDATPVFSAIFQDPDASNTASKYRIQVASDSGFTTILWDSGAAGTAISACAVGARCRNIVYAGTSLNLDGSMYYWRIKYWDNTDIEGAFSAGFTDSFETDREPTAPTNLFSNDSSAQAGLTNPVGILAGRPNFSAIYNDPDGTDIANKFRIQVDDDNDFSSPVWDSGAAGTSMTSCVQGQRCADIAYGGTTELARDEKTYYWRIKFFDQADVESPWSEDPIATNKFTMGLNSSSIQQKDVVQNTVPNTPRAVGVQVVNSTTLRYTWADLSNNETGFRVIDEEGNTVVAVEAGVTSAEETGLPTNTPISGRRVVAFNSAGVSEPSGQFTTTVTAMPFVQPVLVRRGANSVTFTITPSPNNLSTGDSALMFEVIVRPSDPTQSVRMLTSDWQKVSEYTFNGVSGTDDVEVRVMTRNQSGYANEPTEYIQIDELVHHFTVNIHVVRKGTNELPRPIPPSSIVAVTLRIKNTGMETATNVFASMLLPHYIKHRFGSLTIDGRTVTDIADDDVAQTSDRDVSAVWGSMAAGEEHVIGFDLTFDQPALRALKDDTVASANPLVNLQATLGFAESDVVFTSPVVTLEPDLALVSETTTNELIQEEPVQPPTQQDVNEIDQIINGLLEEEAQPSISQPASGQEDTTPDTQTSVSSDGPSFNLDVTRTTGQSLSVVGYASPAQSQIEFTGTTSQPNAVVTLIFNGNVTVIITSDENGNWRTFVSAEQLGIIPGQKSEVTIEAVAAKGDLRSDRVQVGKVTVGVENTGDIQADFETVVSRAPVITAINEIRREVAKQIEKQQPAIQTTLATTAPVVIVSSAPLWGYLPYLPTMIYHAITYLVGLIGRKRHDKQRFYGVVYDSITKQPLALAIIRIYNKETNKLVGTQVSDKQGRYEALLEPAQYRLEVTKPTYSFPSQIVTTEVDGTFQHVYKPEQGMTLQEQDITVPDLPLDPVNAQRQWQLTSGIKKIWLALQKVGNYLAVPILIIGSIASVLVLITLPENPINWLLAVIYVGMLAAQLKLRQHIQKAWGVVYDIATNATLPLATIQLIDPQYGKVITSRLTDYQGRYSFMPEPGHYVIKANKPGYEQINEVVEAPNDKHNPLKGEVSIEKPDERITGDVAMKQV